MSPRLGRLIAQATFRRPSAPKPADDSLFAPLLPSSREALGELRSVVESANQAGGSYHRLAFGPGLTIAGDYDLARYLSIYRLPQDLENRRVLDVGTASGFWALECARRGADVTAVDIYDAPLLSRLLPHLRASVRYERCSVYDLARLRQEFDLVVCGSLLLHLPDLLGALESLRSVCRGRALVATACPVYSRFVRRAVCEFRGRRATDGDYYHYWDVSASALGSLLRCAGFPVVGPPTHFLLESEAGRTRFATPHVLLDAAV